MAEHGLSTRISPSRGAGEILILALLFVILAAALAGLTVALQGPDWVALSLSLLLALLLAWGLAYLRQPAIRAVLILLPAGLLFLLLIPGGLAGKLAGLAMESARRLIGLLPFYKSVRGNPQQLNILLGDLAKSISVLLQRVEAWTKALASGKPAYDPVAATLVWNGLVWIVAAWAGWIVEARRNALLAVSPAVLLSLGTLSASQRLFPGLYLVLGFTLLLTAAVQQGSRQRGWNTKGVAYPARKGRQILNSALFASLLLVGLSAALPSLSVQRIRHWIDELRRPAEQAHGSLAQSLGVLPGGTAVPDEFRAARSPGLPRDHLIGSGPELSDRVVMTVGVENLAALSQNGQPLPLYWRGFTYDVYTGQGWNSSDTTTETLAANEPLQPGQAASHIPVQQDFSPVENLGGTIYAAGEPVTANLPSLAAWRSTGDLFGIGSAHSTAYQIISLVPVADEQTLRQAGEIYPDWVRERFLALPPEIPERVKALALRLTAEALTPYDRAVAIEEYLRTFPYTLDVPYPPQQRDVVDYFLFDLKKGYCDYFATSMVVLARAAGIPARLAVGYAPGTFNLNSRRFVVTEADAHSWAEVYFPGIGWMPFEATPSRPALDRSQPLPAETPPAIIPSALPAGQPAAGRPWALFPASLIALAALLGLAWLGLDDYRLRRLPGPLAAAEVYRRMRRHALRLGLRTERGITPFEFSAAFSRRLAELTGFGKNDPVEAVQALLREIVLASYRPSEAQAGPLAGHWLRLRWRLWLIRIRKAAGRNRAGRSSQIGRTVA
ncbi:MAG TPA: transglutaminaseTgpA domain-containing protein [Anaerolineales bacterium]|nr:transglutaminaseTgpA domain-containing protein [Anaerolineales bacterium]